MKRFLIPAMLSALLAATAAGQGLFGPGGESYVGNPVSGLFSSDRISMHQSFSASYLASGKSGLFTNLYRNTIEYRVSDKLQMQLGLGYRFTPSAGARSSVNPLAVSADRGMFLPSFSMSYRPSGSVLLQFQYETADPFRYPWWGR
ncbi:MAG: hypothetical protein MUF78_09105 [Candidatus Edwardsbacteria bacterium]|jgi:hypothetical protein|nr:hypothetical protein [Candidatus Edwardsbacteria bacterium]